METKSELRRRPSMASRIVWVFLCFVLWAWAIMGPLALAIGALSIVVDPQWVSFEGATTEAKLSNMGLAAFLGVVGISFVWLRWAGYLKFGDETP